MSILSPLPLGEPAAAAGLCLELAWIHGFAGRGSDAVEVARRGADLFGPAHAERRAMALGEPAMSASVAGRVREAEPLYEERRGGDGDLDRARALLGEAVARYEAMKIPATPSSPAR